MQLRREYGLVLLHNKDRSIRDNFGIEIEGKYKKVETHSNDVEEVAIMIDNIKGHCSNSITSHTEYNQRIHLED